MRIYRTLTETHKKALIPAISYVIFSTDVLKSRLGHDGPASPSLSHKPTFEPSGSKRLITLLTISAAIALRGGSSTPAVLALGCCDALLVAVSLSFLRDAHRAVAEADNGGRNVVAVNGFLSQPSLLPSPGQASLLVVMRDVAVAATAMLWLAAFALEDLTFARFRYAPALGQITSNHSFLGQQVQIVGYGLLMVLVHVALNTTLVIVVCFHFLSLITVELRGRHASPRNALSLACGCCVEEIVETDCSYPGNKPWPIACRFHTPCFHPDRPTKHQFQSVRPMVCNTVHCFRLLVPGRADLCDLPSHR